MTAAKIAAVAAIIAPIAALQLQPFQIQTTHLPLPIAGQAYRAQLQAVGGTRPYRWTALRPPLPPGFLLQEATGVITGTPQNNRPFSVLVQVADSADPPLQITRLLTSSAGAPLDIAWTQVPAVETETLAGAVRVSNDSGGAVDLTVIVVAVNEIGKAFALRYDHESLAAQASTPDLAFQVAMPPGQYVVHVDAVGEVAATGAIYRDRLQQAGLTVPPLGLAPSR